MTTDDRIKCMTTDDRIKCMTTDDRIKSTNAKYFLQFFLKSQRKIHYIET